MTEKERVSLERSRRWLVKRSERQLALFIACARQERRRLAQFRAELYGSKLEADT